MERKKLDAAVAAVMRGTEHRTAQELAAELGCSEATVRAARSIARSRNGVAVDCKRGRKTAIEAQRASQAVVALRALQASDGATVYELAAGMGVALNRARVLVRSLVSSGAVRSDGATPPRYLAVPE